ncbi:MAG: SAM-dependent methyltransferase [Enterovirga sp.]|jgi:SAM-dependent methyltransferase|nr:SAM-dependent methyltransferase [Enterovirga sp.]
MDSSAPRVFDRALIRRRLLRAERTGFATFLLERAADDLVERLGAVTRPFATALDIGTPAPIAAETIRRVRPDAFVARLAPIAWGGSPIPVAIGDEEALPVGPASIDLAVSLLALQSANDLPGALLQIRRALKPDGLFLACLFGGDTLTELRLAFAAAESELEGGASPRVAPFADVRSLGGLLQRAGFALPVVDRETVTVRYGNAFRLMADLRQMGLANPLAERRRIPLRRQTLLRMAEIYAERFADPDGRIRATFDMVWLSGWAPHESQQKPLRPGSARARLADALGVPELGAGGAPRDEGGGT